MNFNIDEKHIYTQQTVDPRLDLARCKGDKQYGSWRPGVCLRMSSRIPAAGSDTENNLYRTREKCLRDLHYFWKPPPMTYDTSDPAGTRLTDQEAADQKA